jgi:hypothetical protein
MRTLLLPFFILRLLASLIPFALEILVLLIQQYLGLALFLLLVSFYITSFVKLVKQNIFFIDETTPQAAYTQSPTKNTINQIQQRLFADNQVVFYQDDPKVKTLYNQLLLLNNETPAHRDVLTNLAIIETEDGNLKTAREYLQDIEYSDPNNPNFK